MQEPTLTAGLLEAIKPQVGRTVFYIMPTSKKVRPAVIVETFGGSRPDGRCNLQVFVDGLNDGVHRSNGTLWATAISRDDSVTREGTWHWPEYTCEGQAIAHVLRERTVYEQTQTEKMNPPEGR